MARRKDLLRAIVGKSPLKRRRCRLGEGNRTRVLRGTVSININRDVGHGYRACCRVEVTMVIVRPRPTRPLPCWVGMKHVRVVIPPQLPTNQTLVGEVERASAFKVEVAVKEKQRDLTLCRRRWSCHRQQRCRVGKGTSRLVERLDLAHPLIPGSSNVRRGIDDERPGSKCAPARDGGSTKLHRVAPSG